ncbi:hypothetical protein SN13T_2581 [Lactiplantibacillus plantarum]|nr:hypothetical protein SN13T_2581 [Lactiplantibacillus plantarum]
MKKCKKSDNTQFIIEMRVIGFLSFNESVFRFFEIFSGTVIGALPNCENEDGANDQYATKNVEPAKADAQ